MRPGLAVAGVLLIALGLFIGFGWLSSETSSANAQVREPVSSVRIDNDSGNVDIRVGERASVRETFHYRFSEPAPSHSVEDGELVLGDCGWWCSVDYEVVVPPGTAVTGEADAGNVRLDGVDSADVEVNSGETDVRNVAGEVRVNSNSGEVRLDRIGGQVEVEANSGTTRGTGLGGPVTVDASSGDVELALDRPNDVRLDISSGNAGLRLPPGDYRFETDTSSGEEDNALPSTPDAPNTVEADISSGNLRITRS